MVTTSYLFHFAGALEFFQQLTVEKRFKEIHLLCQKGGQLPISRLCRKS
jgi:hypothetical protein